MIAPTLTACTPDTSGVLQAMDIARDLLVAGVARATACPLSPDPSRVPSHWLRQKKRRITQPFAPNASSNPTHSLTHPRDSTHHRRQLSFVTAMAEFDIGVKSMVAAFKAIASLLGTKTTTTMIGKDMCLGFDNFDLNTSSNVIECMADEYLDEWVTLEFSDLAWAFDSPDA